MHLRFVFVSGEGDRGKGLCVFVCFYQSFHVLQTAMRSRRTGTAGTRHGSSPSSGLPPSRGGVCVSDLNMDIYISLSTPRYTCGSPSVAGGRRSGWSRYFMPLRSTWLAAMSITLMMKAMAKAQMRLFRTQVCRICWLEQAGKGGESQKEGGCYPKHPTHLPPYRR